MCRRSVVPIIEHRTAQKLPYQLGPGVVTCHEGNPGRQPGASTSAGNDDAFGRDVELVGVF